MKIKELKQLDTTLDNFNDIGQILKDKRGYYIYYNKPNKKEKPIKIHKHYCGECSWGSGKIKNKTTGKNGVWIGPFSNAGQVDIFIKDNFPTLVDKVDKSCGCLTK